MRLSRRRAALTCLVAGLAASSLLVTSPRAVSASAGAQATTARHVAPFGRSPLAFEPNLGQFADPAIRFVSRGKRYTLELTSTEAVMALTRPLSRPGRRDADNDGMTSPSTMARPPVAIMHMKLVGADT